MRVAIQKEKTISLEEIQKSTLIILKELKQLISLGEVERTQKLLDLHIRAIEEDIKA